MQVKKIPFYSLWFLLRITFQNGGISLKRLPLFIVYLFRYVLLEPFRLCEIWIYDRKIKAFQPDSDPVFVIGHWRSGTSHLQTLLCKDPRNVTTTIFRFLFSDTYYLTEGWLKAPINGLCRLFKVQYAFQRLPMNFDIPGELDPALCSNCSKSAYTWGHLFPDRFGSWFEDFVMLKDESLEKQWLADYDYLIHKLAMKNKGKRVVVKSPGDTGRVTALQKIYPDAKFIYIHRDPVAVFHSTRYLWSIIQKENSFQKISDAQIDEHILMGYKKLVPAYLNSRKGLPKGQLKEISFEELQQNPLVVMQSVYDELNLGTFPAEELKQFLDLNKTYKINQYPADSNLEEKLRTEWPFAFPQIPN